MQEKGSEFSRQSGRQSESQCNLYPESDYGQKQEAYSRESRLQTLCLRGVDHAIRLAMAKKRFLAGSTLSEHGSGLRSLASE